MDPPTSDSGPSSASTVTCGTESEIADGEGVGADSYTPDSPSASFAVASNDPFDCTWRDDGRKLTVTDDSVTLKSNSSSTCLAAAADSANLTVEFGTEGPGDVSDCSSAG